ncbi:bis(5'-nucleosyl)-tetraphosphatase [Bdellovibrio sp. NC01]|uniref:bis(5'-nucleosyl)-tetraphosphatase n=1 Tax=Bdellovibrio sp. NC01 TaxID=2220073 RepID=UPI001157815E|nr:NUDIX domain-containing protein [Bdellovibrio sp. NC01]QDK38003.1 NUDIX hydrolase [Bdellovibrio sp. NC01]
MKSNVLSAGVIPFLNEKPLRFLLLRSYNYWDFPKGEVEEGEDPFLAAQRELKEETGLEPYKFPFKKEFIETEPYGKGKVARYYIAEMNTDKVVLGINEELGRPEHQQYKWMTYEEALEVTVPRLQRVLKWVNAKLS